MRAPNLKPVGSRGLSSAGKAAFLAAGVLFFILFIALLAGPGPADLDPRRPPSLSLGGLAINLDWFTQDLLAGWTLNAIYFSVLVALATWLVHRVWCHWHVQDPRRGHKGPRRRSPQITAR